MQSVENILRSLTPDPKFYGSLVANNEEAYDVIDWVDDRPKPTWQELVDASGPYELAITIQTIETQIKGLANKTILTIADENQQRNMLAVGLEISDKKTDGIPITEAETKMSEDILAVWALIKAIRAKSNELETIYVNKGEDLTTDDLITIENTLKQAGGLS